MLNLLVENISFFYPLCWCEVKLNPATVLRVTTFRLKCIVKLCIQASSSAIQCWSKSENTVEYLGTKEIKDYEQTCCFKIYYV